MNLDQGKLVGLMREYCNGNYNRFARELGVDPGHLYKFLTTGVGGGRKILGGVMKFCMEKNLKFEDYTDLC